MAKIDSIDRPTDAAFLLFHYAKEVQGVTKVQKLLFLIEEETQFGNRYNEDISFNFEPYKMGPFSSQVYEQIELLLVMDAIEDEPMKVGVNDRFETESMWSDTGSEALSNKKFRVTEKGHKIARSLEKVLNNDERSDLENTIEYYNSMPLRQLLEYVYENYEEMTIKSEIKNEVLE